MEKIKRTRKYPEYFVNSDRFEQFTMFTEDSYAKELQKAKIHAKKTGGELYTVIDHPNGLAFEKGVHFVNRLGYAVVKY